MGSFDTYLERKLRELIRGVTLAAGGDITLSGDLFIDGRIGNGTASPQGRWHSVGIGDFLDFGYGAAIVLEPSAADEYPSIFFRGQAPNNWSALVWTANTVAGSDNNIGAMIEAQPVSATDTNIYFWTNTDVGGSPPTAKMELDHAGRLGVAGNGTLAEPTVSMEVTGTDAFLLPKGTTGERPAGVDGYIRFNTTTSRVEAYYGGVWNNL